MMFVSWSDQNNILIYRTFEDFRKFHKELKRKFPTENGSLRSLPRFKGKDKSLMDQQTQEEKMLLQGPRSIAVLSQLCPCYFEGITMQQRKGGKLNRCLEILKLLETYSQELLKTDVKISRGEEVIQFFKAQTQDLDPSFPENSAVIMPSVFRREKSPQPLSITLPQASQSYRCIEAFETKDTKNKPFTVAQEEIVEVLIKDMTGWWLVENADKQIAWFPASYLEELDACEDIQNAFSSDEEGSLYFVVQAYEAQKADELSLNQGVVVEVLRTSHNGWWLIRYNGCTGYMPSLCLRPYQNPHHKLQSILSCSLHTCTPSLSSREEHSSARSRSRSLPQASSTSGLDLGLDSSSLSSGSSSAGNARLARKPELSRSLPEVEPARSSPGPSHELGTHSSKCPELSAKDRNDSGFVEPSTAEPPPADPELAAGVPKVPARPSAQEILQRCSTVTKRAVQHSAPRPALPDPSQH
ncbi:NADPH oxidase organizer 1 [Ammospiza nelsoni]|uniref:NADPH oxidase organizer 1 n=1 Tax=Ammospiza nelsoni TaxID=2857394 RepID=UPI002869BB13|nr:NADPH oxidase organizer 1 [Ammospiza nelsoni]